MDPARHFDLTLRGSGPTAAHAFVRAVENLRDAVETGNVRAVMREADAVRVDRGQPGLAGKDFPAEEPRGGERRFLFRLTLAGVGGTDEAAFAAASDHLMLAIATGGARGSFECMVASCHRIDESAA